MVRDPLKRINTGDNTPAIIYYDVVPGDVLEIELAAKGFGSENMSATKMLKPSDGKAGVKAFVIDTILKAGSNPCPPIVVGVGIGGTIDKAAQIAKRALFRDLGEPNTDEDVRLLEEELFSEINALGIGPQGLVDGLRRADDGVVADHADRLADHGLGDGGVEVDTAGPASGVVVVDGDRRDATVLDQQELEVLAADDGRTVRGDAHLELRTDVGGGDRTAVEGDLHLTGGGNPGGAGPGSGDLRRHDGGGLGGAGQASDQSGAGGNGGND